LNKSVFNRLTIKGTNPRANPVPGFRHKGRGMYRERFNGLIISIGLLFLLSSVRAGNHGIHKDEAEGARMYFRTLSRENGLPSPIVNCFIQDFRGYIWIGTSDGLARYDGHDMKVYRSKAGDASSLTDNMIYSLKEMSDSTIWIGTADGFSVFNPATATFRSFSRETKGMAWLEGMSIRCFYESMDGSVWIGTDNNLILTDQANSRFKLIRLQQSEDPVNRSYHFRNIASVCEDPRNPDKLFLATAGGLLLLDKKSRRVEKDYMNNTGLGYCLEGFWFNRDSSLWTFGWGVGLLRLDLGTETWRNYPCYKTPVTIKQIVPLNQDEFLLATPEYGLGLFNKVTKSFRFIAKTQGDPYSIIDNNINCIARFNNGKDLWIGTWEGISIENRRVFSFSRNTIPYPTTWTGDFFYDSERKNLYIGGYGSDGLYCRDENSGSWKIFQEQEPHSREKLCITMLYRDHQGVLWVCTRRNLMFLRPGSNILEHFHTADGQLLKIKDPVVYSVLEDARGYLWLGTRFDGIIRLDPERRWATYFNNDPKDPYSLSKGNHFSSIVTDRFGRIWFSHSNGVSIYDPADGRFLNYLVDSLQHYGIKKRWINTMNCDSLGRIWLGFSDEGLVRVEINAKNRFTFGIFNTSNGLNVPGVDWIAKDNRGTFWISNKGLLHLNPYTGAFRFFDKRNGLHENPAGASKIYVDNNNRLYFDSKGAFDRIPIDDLDVSDSLPMRLVIESAEVNGKKVIIPGFGSIKPVSFPAGQNNLIFHYTAICFKDAERIRYKYMLEGYDKEWYTVENGLEARYTNLPAGHYKFILAATIENGNREYRKDFSFTISPYFWRTWWFVITSLLLLAVLISGVYFYKMNELKRLVRVRSRIAADLHDEVSSTLSSISILSVLLRKKVKDPESSLIVDEIGANADSTLERIDEIIWFVNPLNDKFENLGQRISEFASPLFELKNIEFLIDYPDRMVNIRLAMENRRNIFLIAKEAVNNILKYAACTKASIRFNYENGCVEMEITDNGTGFDPAVETSRNGLRNMKQRAERITGVLKIDSSPGQGTCIHLRVRVS